MELIAIGRIAKPIGTRGEVKVFSLTENTERFLNLRSVWIGHSEASAQARLIASVRVDAKYAAVGIEGFRTSHEAEQLRDKYIFIPQEHRAILNDGKYFIDDVIGCEVVTEDLKKVGQVTDVLRLPANDAWVIRDDTHEFLIPAVKEIIRKVDVGKKRITIHALEGLLE